MTRLPDIEESGTTEQHMLLSFGSSDHGMPIVHFLLRYLLAQRGFLYRLLSLVRH